MTVNGDRGDLKYNLAPGAPAYLGAIGPMANNFKVTSPQAQPASNHGTPSTQQWQ